MAAEAAGLTPIKLNTVVTAGYNETDVMDLARLTIERDWHVRFIELMPLGGGECARLSVERYVSNIETRRRIEAALGPMTEIPAENPADEARNYRLRGARGVIGFISPVSEPYCGTCNRMRLTADGKFHLCLLNDDELDVKKSPPLRRRRDRKGGRHPASARSRMKPTGHHLLEGPLDPRPLDVPNRGLIEDFSYAYRQLEASERLGFISPQETPNRGFAWGSATNEQIFRLTHKRSLLTHFSCTRTGGFPTPTIWQATR